MPSTAPFVNREFYDVPRFLAATHRGQQFLFESAFDDDLDEYPAVDQVSLLRNVPEDELKGLCAYLSEKVQARLGTAPVKDIVFDETRRREIETDVLERLLADAPRRLMGAAR